MHRLAFTDLKVGMRVVRRKSDPEQGVEFQGTIFEIKGGHSDEIGVTVTRVDNQPASGVRFFEFDRGDWYEDDGTLTTVTIELTPLELAGIMFHLSASDDILIRLRSESDRCEAGFTKEVTTGMLSFQLYEKVRKVAKDYGIHFTTGLPVKKSEEPIVIAHNPVEFKADGIQVGCTFVSKETIEEIAKRLQEQKQPEEQR